jgi:hypothetical protein
VVLVFARGLSDGLIGLIKQVDSVVAADPEKATRAFVAVLQPADDALKQKLAKLAAEQKIAIPLVIPVDQPPGGYPLSADAYATVLVYNKHKVKENFALRENELDEKVVADIIDAAKHVKDDGPRKKDEPKKGSF